MKIYNTLTQKKEEFASIEPGHIKIYLCGPTVYGLVHVGNFRGPIVFNFVTNYFKSLGNKVTFVYNYTDVDDKIILQSIKENVPASEISQKYIKEFERDFALVGLETFEGDPLVKRLNPRVTDNMPEIVSLIEDIVKNEAGYVVDGEVFCSIEKIKEYGKLSHKNIDDLIAGTRVEIGEKKKNPLDFTLWKPAKPGEPSWPSPWGMGRPGWHIECSAMAKKYLGETFDIHGGGIDLIFPHHENEIAQSESGTGHKFVNYWMHNNFINQGKEKMSKSLGNIFTARNFVEKFNGEILKFLILSSHYRSAADFSEEVIHNSISGLARIYSALSRATQITADCEKQGIKEKVQIEQPAEDLLDPKGFGFKCTWFLSNIRKAANDDFNTPEIMAEIFNLVRAYNGLLKPSMKASVALSLSSQKFIELVTTVGKWMSLFQKPPQEFLMALDNILLSQKGLNREEIQKLVGERWQARTQKDFNTSDLIRDKLSQMGIEVRDSSEGSQWEVKK